MEQQLLFIDKEKQRVLFAESGKEFVDVLFSFLTLPLGTVVRLLGKQSGVGCLDEVYKSVESLSTEHFQTEACRNMLLRPLNAAAGHCDRLKVNVDYRDLRSIYLVWVGGQWIENTDGVFVKSGPMLIITDDLQVAPASTGYVFSLLDKFGLNEKADIKEEFLFLDCEKIMSLLKRTLISKEPLTGLYFNTVVTPDAVRLDEELPANLSPKQESNDAQEVSAIKIKLIQTADNSAVLYAEVGQDFVDLIFGLLSVPLGFITKAYGQWPPNGCLDNLYRSVDGSAKGCIREDRRSLLLSPKLAAIFGCSMNVLQFQESDPKGPYSVECVRCFKARVDKCTCSNYYSYESISEMNPKSPSRANVTSRAYIKGGPRNFIVTNDLRVFHFSLANTLQVMRAAMIPKEKLVEKELTLDKTQGPLALLVHVLKLLRAAVATRDALSSVLLPAKKKRHAHH
ncbi:hypothetical protein C2845_PM15G20450 [Panicum miliaceum]|uniref:DUF674 family protein n=1 Tax=Panicum miliaceum TaxID=4540 RepID=A0A3L6Q731_PANMI|nr:hypothetical protein C2845_PM15G20450 [Panicum miliaceum]